MNFRSLTDQPIHVALTTGHTAVITPDGGPLDPMFHKEAAARGAVAFDGPASTPLTGADRKAAITAALQQMVVDNDPEDFTGEGKPALARLKAKVGFHVSREEADTLFAELPA